MKKKLEQKYTAMANMKDKILVSGPIPIWIEVWLNFYENEFQILYFWANYWEP